MHTHTQQNDLLGNNVLSRGFALLAGFGLTRASDLIPSLALLAAAREARESQRLRDAHLRRFAYEPIKLTTRAGVEVPALRQHSLQWGKYTGSALRDMRRDNGVGRQHAPDLQQRTKIALPWNPNMSRVVAFTAALDEKGTPCLVDMKIYRGNGMSSKMRRDRRLEKTMRDEHWALVIKAVLVKLADMANSVAGQRIRKAWAQ